MVVHKDTFCKTIYFHDSMASFIIPAPKEFSFQQCLHFLRRSPDELLHTCDNCGVEKVISVNGKAVLFSVRIDEKQQLSVSVLNHTASASIKQSIISYIETWFDLKTDLVPFYKMASKDPVLKPLVKKYFGYRVVSMPDLFESLSWAIIGQQINLRFAYSLKQRFVQQFGERLNWKGKTYYLFPDPVKIAALQPASLLSLQFSRQKAAYVIGIAKAFADGTVSTGQLGKLPFEKAKENLKQLKGIGNWTANYALMKTFHFPNAFPLEDAGLHQAIRKQLQLDTKPTLQQIEQLFKKYRGWEAYATLYLWRSLGED